MLLLLLACRLPEGASDSFEALDCAHEANEPDIDPAKTCHDGDELLVESGYEGLGTHFAWTVEECFLVAGGSIPDVDAPSVVVQCPPCRAPGSQIFDMRIDVMDDEGDPVGWSYRSIAHVCAND